MYIHPRALARQPASRAGVVEVDVCQQKVGHVAGRQTLACQSRFQTRESRTRSAFDQHDSIAAANEVRGNRLRASLKIQVKCDNTGLRHDISCEKVLTAKLERVSERSASQ